MGALMNALTQPWPSQFNSPGLTQAQPVADVRKPMPLETGGGAGPASSVFVPRGYGEKIPDVLPRGAPTRNLDRPIHPSVLEEMRAAGPEKPPTNDPRPIHESTLREMMEAGGQNTLAPPKSPVE